MSFECDSAPALSPNFCCWGGEEEEEETFTTWFCVLNMCILRPHSPPFLWGNVIGDILQRRKPRSHRLPSSKGVEPGINPKSGFFLFLDVPLLSWDFQTAGSACPLRPKYRVELLAGILSVIPPEALRTYLAFYRWGIWVMDCLTAARKTRPTSVWPSFCSVRGNMAQQFILGLKANELCSYPSRIGVAQLPCTAV